MTRRRVVETGCWWAALTGLFLMLPSTIDTTEAVAAVLAGGLASGVAAVATKEMRPEMPPARVPYWRLLLLPADVARDVVVLLRHLGDRSEGRRDKQVLESGEPSGGMRSVAVLTLSSSPGSYVLDVVPQDGGPDLVLVHRTCGGGAGLVEDMVVAGDAEEDES